MRVNLTVEVESLAALRAVLAAGRDYALYDCKVINFKVEYEKPVHRSSAPVES